MYVHTLFLVIRLNVIVFELSTQASSKATFVIESLIFRLRVSRYRSYIFWIAALRRDIKSKSDFIAVHSN